MADVHDCFAEEEEEGDDRDDDVVVCYAVFGVSGLCLRRVEGVVIVDCYN